MMVIVMIMQTLMNAVMIEEIVVDLMLTQNIVMNVSAIGILDVQLQL